MSLTRQKAAKNQQLMKFLLCSMRPTLHFIRTIRSRYDRKLAKHHLRQPYAGKTMTVYRVKNINLSETEKNQTADPITGNDL